MTELVAVTDGVEDAELVGVIECVGDEDTDVEGVDVSDADDEGEIDDEEVGA